jgi:hypothetical protein
MSVCLSTRGVPSVVVRTSVILGAVMPTPRWAIGGGKTHALGEDQIADEASPIRDGRSWSGDDVKQLRARDDNTSRLWP